MNILVEPADTAQDYRRILGVRFFVGAADGALRRIPSARLVLAPSGPGLADMDGDPEYREALLGADLVITDSGLLVLLWNLIKGDNVTRLSGLSYLKLLLARPEFRDPGSVLWVMPSRASMERNLTWLKEQGYPVDTNDCYLAPRYPSGKLEDERLACLIDERRPKHVIVTVGGGVQERLGFYLRRTCAHPPTIHCIGAAIGFLTGDQVRIPSWADRMMLGWLIRCLWRPSRFVPRYVRALRLPLVLWRYRDQLPMRKGNGGTHGESGGIEASK